MNICDRSVYHYPSLSYEGFEGRLRRVSTLLHPGLHLILYDERALPRAVVDQARRKVAWQLEGEGEAVLAGGSLAAREGLNYRSAHKEHIFAGMFAFVLFSALDLIAGPLRLLNA